MIFAFASGAAASMLGHQCVRTAYGHGEIDTQLSEPVRQFRGAASGGMYHVEDTALGVERRAARYSIRAESANSGLTGNPNTLMFSMATPAALQDRGTLFVRDEEVIRGGTAIPARR